jgi:hypothetical protein
MLFIVAGGQKLDKEGKPEEHHAAQGVFGLIVLTPNGAESVEYREAAFVDYDGLAVDHA